jgi:hypothetical protein
VRRVLVEAGPFPARRYTRRSEERLLAGFVQLASNTIAKRQRELNAQVRRLADLLQQNQKVDARVRGAVARTTALNERLPRRCGGDLRGPAQNPSRALLRLDVTNILQALQARNRVETARLAQKSSRAD